VSAVKPSSVGAGGGTDSAVQSRIVNDAVNDASKQLRQFSALPLT